ncbi:DNA repair protein Rev1 isoform X2 [Adelges cooleyi]|uniref:DNA repair protein Rev1 isoform X2 n=1 Tax=Adelges cooleyi TaxID=133065 RepID=UPI0021809A1A|nr:DNA repair protein Rev1 isoform X2 [Adelges cooleyi]
MKKRQTTESDGFEEWGGYMEAKKSKLEDQFMMKATSSENKVKSQIFKGISIFVNGYTLPSTEELKCIMMENGGIYHHYHRPGLTTHIIASNLPNAKLKLLKQYKIVKPEWISESLKEGKLRNYRDYLLFVDKVDQPKIDFPMRAKNASEPSFLSEFYNNSRLHLISTMATTFKQLVIETRKLNQTTYPGRLRLKKWVECNEAPEFVSENIDYGRVIMHIDMDCFFVSVGLVERPELHNMPVAVTHAKGNSSFKRYGVNREAEFNLYSKRWKGNDTDSDENEGEETKRLPLTTKRDGINDTDSMAEIACCSYEARKAGIKNGMLVGQALKMCPGLKLIPYNFENYKKVAHILYTHIMNDYTLDVEAVSCDELYLDCTQILETTKSSPLQLATFLRKEIKEKTNCPCSTGIGPNCLLARLATKKAKPDGQLYVEPDAYMDFMTNINISDLPGVGRNLSHKLSTLEISTCGQLRALSLQTLQSEFGNKIGQSLYKYCHGEDDRKLNYDYRPKSVSAEVNYGIRFRNQEESENFIKQLCEEVEKRLDDVEMKGRTVTLKLMVRNAEAPKESAKFLGHGFCDHVTKSSPLIKLTSDSKIIFQTVVKIMNQLKIDPTELRGIGIQINRLESRTLKRSGRIENFISNMKFLPNHTSPGIDANLVVRLPKLTEANAIHNLPSEAMKNTELSNNSKSKKIVEFFQPKNYKPDNPLFLEALPEDLRLELENELKYQEQTHVTETNEKNVTTISEESSRLYQQVHIDQMKEFMEEWVSTEHEPKDCDNIMVSEYLCSLIKDTRTTDAYELLRKLYRLVKCKEQITWKQSYFNIMKNVQETMLKLYNAKMKVETLF